MPFLNSHFELDCRRVCVYEEETTILCEALHFPSIFDIIG